MTPWSTIRSSPRLKLALILIAVAVAGYTLLRAGQAVDREAIIESGRRLPAWLLIGGFMVLPLLGVPVSLFLLVIGIRFGLGWGILLTSVAMTFHHLAVFRITHGLLHRRVRGWCQRLGYPIPPVPEHRRTAFTVVFALVHGPPYIAKLYLLALTNIPLRTYLVVGAPIYILSALPLLAFGHAFISLNPGWIAAAIAILIATVAIGRWVKRSLS